MPSDSMTRATGEPTLKTLAMLGELDHHATPAPWTDDQGYRAYGPLGDLLFETKHTSATGYDSTFIVALRNAYPGLLARLSALEGEVERLTRENVLLSDAFAAARKHVRGASSGGTAT